MRKRKRKRKERFKKITKLMTFLKKRIIIILKSKEQKLLLKVTLEQA
jgi:hypothetical protein